MDGYTLPKELQNVLEGRDQLQVNIESSKLSTEIQKLKLLDMLNNLDFNNHNQIVVFPVS